MEAVPSVVDDYCETPTPDGEHLLDLATRLWPNVRFYGKQREMFNSVEYNDETIIPAGNQLGKDFTAAPIILTFFLTRTPCRIVTTSVKSDHLGVLWSEIRRFIDMSSVPLKWGQGGPLVVNPREHLIRKISDMELGIECKTSYIKGMVAENYEAFQGHHAATEISADYDPIHWPLTMFVVDEASGVPDQVFKVARTWSHRRFIFGNPWPTENYFKHAVKGNPATDDPGGDLPRLRDVGFRRKIIQMQATDSPNVALGLVQVARGEEPTGEIIVPGVLTYDQYQTALVDLDEHEKCVRLYADWYDGKQNKLFPVEWLQRAQDIARELLRTRPKRVARTMGVDTALGGDNTCWTIIDQYGIILQESMKTPDTTVIPAKTKALIREHELRPEHVYFDGANDGTVHVQRLRAEGYNVNAVAFGATRLETEWQRQFGSKSDSQIRRDREARFAYVNRRAEMYGMASLLLNPLENPQGFGIPSQYTQLLKQLRPVPKLYDGEGRLKLPPKNAPSDALRDNKTTMVKLVGHSPDESDSFVLACYGLLKKPATKKVGVAF